MSFFKTENEFEIEIMAGIHLPPDCSCFTDSSNHENELEIEVKKAGVYSPPDGSCLTDLSK